MPNLIGQFILDPVSQSVGKITKILGPGEDGYVRVLVWITEPAQKSHHREGDFVPWRVRL